MLTNPRYKHLIQALDPAIEASLDPVCVLDQECKLVYVSPLMKTLLSIRPREMQKGLVFCDLIKLSVCDHGCKIEQVMGTYKPARFDEVSARIGEKKLRVLLKAVPILDEGSGGQKKPIGIFLSLRDTTAEVIVQAKYHKAMHVLEQRDIKIAELQDQVQSLRRLIASSTLSTK